MGAGVNEFLYHESILTMNPYLKKNREACGGGGGGGGGRGARVSVLFYKESKSNTKIFFGGGEGEGRVE